MEGYHFSKDSQMDMLIARRHPCPSEEHGGGWEGSSTKTEQGAPDFKPFINRLHHGFGNAYSVPGNMVRSVMVTFFIRG